MTPPVHVQRHDVTSFSLIVTEALNEHLLCTLMSLVSTEDEVECCRATLDLAELRLLDNTLCGLSI